MAFRSLEQLVELAWLRYSANRTQGRAELFRHELFGLVDSAMVRLGEKVVSSPNSDWLQRSLLVELNRSRRAVTFPWFRSPVNGLQAGLSIVEGVITADDDNVLAMSAERIVTSGTVTLDVSILTMGSGALALRPTRYADTVSAAYQDAQNLSIVWESGQTVKIFQGGAQVGDTGFQLLSSTILRLVFDAQALTVKRLDSGGNEQATYDATIATDDSARHIIPIFRSKMLRIGIPRCEYGQATIAELPADNRLILPTVESLGSVEFAPPFLGEEYTMPLSWKPQGSYRLVPGLIGIWYYCWDAPVVDGATGAVLRVFSGEPDCPPPSNQVLIQGCVVPTWEELPDHLNEKAVESLLEIAFERAAMGGATKKNGR